MGNLWNLVECYRSDNAQSPGPSDGLGLSSSLAKFFRGYQPGFTRSSPL